ncbi:hypothetical protein ABK040_014320 [Willaertia magna]
MNKIVEGLTTRPPPHIRVVDSCFLFIIHPNYDTHSYKNDIALLELDQDLPLTSLPNKVRTIKIEGLGVPTGNFLHIAGWGLISSGQPYPTQLQKAIIPIVDPNICNASPLRLGMNSPQQICAGNGNGIDSCENDSGGPLFYKDIQGNFIQVGIVSYGPVGCGGKNRGIYTNVAAYKVWISQQVGTYGIEVQNYISENSEKPTCSKCCKCKRKLQRQKAKSLQKLLNMS